MSRDREGSALATIDVMTPRAAAILALCSQFSLFAQATAHSVPFVGCVSYGQEKKSDAAVGNARSVAVDSKDAARLAYYASADGIGLLAPRGWYCTGVSGSGGDALYLSPKPFDRSDPEWKGFSGPAIVANHITSGASGRYEIAEIIARAFPAYRAVARSVWQGIDLPFPRGPYPSDSPVTGVAILIGDPPDLLHLSVRLPPESTRLVPVIVQHFENAALGR